jgi:hypothetical protein
VTTELGSADFTACGPNYKIELVKRGLPRLPRVGLIFIVSTSSISLRNSMKLQRKRIMHIKAETNASKVDDIFRLATLIMEIERGFFLSNSTRLSSLEL